MAEYLAVKSVLMAAAIVGAFGVFYTRAKRLVLLMCSVQGRSGVVPDRMGERVRVLFTDVLGQANVRRKLLPGVSHTLIFFGFLAVQPHSLELMLRGVFPGVHVAKAIPVCMAPIVCRRKSWASWSWWASAMHWSGAWSCGPLT